MKHDCTDFPNEVNWTSVVNCSRNEQIISDDEDCVFARLKRARFNAVANRENGEKR